MPDKPKDTPTFEEIVRQLGLDRMSFMSDMVRPDQHEAREEDPGLSAPPPREIELSPQEQRVIIDGLAQYFGRKPTQQEINLALEQARSF